MSPSRKRLDQIAASGLGIGAVFGMAGTFAASASLRQAFWTLDGVALVVACALLTMKYYRRGCDAVAAGFLVFAIGEGLLLSGTAAGLAASASSFGGGVALWSAGLLLISIPREFPSWVRAAGVVGALLFAVVAVRISWGAPLLPTSAPLPFDAYPVVVATFIGWILSILKPEPAAA